MTRRCETRTLRALSEWEPQSEPRLSAPLILVTGTCLVWWALSLLLNPTNLHVPVSTWVANLAGGLMIGVSLAWFARHPEIDAVWRLTLVTGFLGALTTFSTFSIESLLLLQRGQFGWAFVHSAAHLFGSLAAAAIGYRLAAMTA